jgi:hypothetical protein
VTSARARELGHILEVTKGPDGSYYCIICESEGKQTEKLETNVHLVMHWMKHHFNYYAGLRIGIQFTLKRLANELDQLWKRLLKQKELIRTHDHIS